MKTIEEVKNYLKKELAQREEKVLKYFDIYKSTKDKDVKKYAKKSCDDNYKTISIIEKILQDIEG